MNQTLPCLPAIILAIPSALPSQPPTPRVDLGKQLALAANEIESLMASFNFRQALEKAEALLPTSIDAYRSQTTAEAFSSAITHYNYAQAYFIAFKAADAAGEWEKALEYISKCRSLAHTNKKETEKALSGPMKAWEELRDGGKKIIDANAPRIAELKAKQNPTNADLNELDDYLSAEKNYQIGEESAKTLLFAWDRGTKYAKSYDAYVDYIQQKIEDQEKEIAGYAPTKGDRARWAEAIAQAPSYLNTFTETKEKVAFIHRLMVLAPGSPKVKRALDIAHGKSVAPEPKSKATQKK